MDIEGLVEGIMFDTIEALSQAGLNWSPLRESHFEQEIKGLIKNYWKLIIEDEKIKELRGESEESVDIARVQRPFGKFYIEPIFEGSVERDESLNPHPHGESGGTPKN